MMDIIKHDLKFKNTLPTRKTTTKIILHCTATKEGYDYSVESIHRLHLNNGWSGIGYNFVIYRDGSIHEGRPIDKAGAINQLSTRLNCDVNAINGAIDSVQAAICNVGNRNDMNAMQTINAINSGDAMIANQLSSCCCDVKTEVLKMGYENQINNMNQSQLIQNGFAQVGYASAEQTCAIKQNATDNTSRVLAKLDAIEDDRKNREIANLTAQLTAATSRAERAAELAPVYQALNDIKCKQPNTVTVPYQPFVTVPNCVAYNALGYGLNPFTNNGSIWS